MIRDRIWILIVVLGGLAAFGKLTQRALFGGAAAAVLVGIVYGLVSIIDDVFGVGTWTKIAMSVVGYVGCLLILSAVFG